MKHAGLSWLVKLAGFPIARHAAADSNHTAQDVRVRERETIIQRARLREAKQEDSGPIGDAFTGQRVDQIKQCSTMDRDRFCGTKVCQPAKAEPQGPTRCFWFSQMLVKTLQRRDSEPARRDCLRLAQRVPLARAIAMQRNEQRRRSRRHSNHVVIKFDLGGEHALTRGRGVAGSRVVHRQIRLITRSSKSDKALIQSNSFAFNANESYDGRAFRDSEIKLVEARLAQ